MDRVVVSHDWMGEVFEQFLTTQANDDLKRLFNGVTAIVIGAHVRPSFYYALTGAIYLDADNFWLTAEQRDVIDETPDFRSDFDRDLNYSGVWRYTQNNLSIFVNFPATSRIARTQSYLLAEAGWLLYHELAHASDFLPPSERSRLNDNLGLTAWGFIEPLFTSARLPSAVLSTDVPASIGRDARRWRRSSSSARLPRPSRSRTRRSRSLRSSRPTGRPTSTTTRRSAKTSRCCSRNS